MKEKVRKARPQPPKHAWLNLDGCWFCDNKNNCNGCKVLKQIVAKQKEKRKREYERRVKSEYLKRF